MKILDAILNYDALRDEVRLSHAEISKLKLERNRYYDCWKDEYNDHRQAESYLEKERIRVDELTKENEQLSNTIKKLTYRCRRNAKFAYHARKENHLCRRDNKVLNDVIKEQGAELRQHEKEDSQKVRCLFDEKSKTWKMCEKVWLPVDVVKHLYKDGLDIMQINTDKAKGDKEK